MPAKEFNQRYSVAVILSISHAERFVAVIRLKLLLRQGILSAGVLLKSTGSHFS